MIDPRTSSQVENQITLYPNLPLLEAIGGEALEGSGFEIEQPDPGFKEGD